MPYFIAAQLTQLRKDSLFLDDGVTSSSTQIKSLIDNAVAELSRLNLTAFDVATRGLSSSQANSLTNDIITFEATNINGMSIIVPKIYLSLSTRNKLLGTSDSVTSDSASASLATGSTIYSGGDLTINSPSASLTNNGSIISNGNLTLNLASLTSTSSITTLPTIAAPTIKSVAGSINIATTNNITLKNTLLNSGNKITLSAKDINISNDNPIFVTSSSSYSSSTPLLFATSSIKDDAEAARSAITFNAASDIELNSSGSINIANNYLNTSGSIFMTAASDINNSNYTIKAAENVVMSAGNNINNISTAKTAAEAEATPTKIEAGSIVSLDAGNNINNIGATIKGGDLVYLTAANNVNNLALVNYSINGQTTNQDQTITTGSAKRGNLTTTTISGYSTDSETGLTSNAITQTQALESNANNIKSTLVSQGSITAGESSTGTSGNVVIVAGHNLNNKASNITATGDTYLEATAGDINIETAALRDRVVTSGGKKNKAWTKTEDAITNLESSITSSGTLDLASLSGDIKITGSKLIATDNLTLSAANDVNISAAQDTAFLQNTFSSKGRLVSKSSISMSQSVTNVKSELESGGDISIISGDDTNLIGAKLKAEAVAITAGNELNIYSVSDSFYSYSSSSKSRNYLAAASAIGAEVIAKLPASSIASTLYSAASDAASSLNSNNSFKSNSTIHDKTSNIASSIDATGNITLTSNQNLVISGSNLSGASGSLTSNAGSISILSAAETDRTTTSSSKISGRTKHPGLKGSKKTSETESETITNIASNLNFTDSLEVKTLSGETSDINVTGSNLAVSDGDLTLSAAGNINIINAIDSTLSTSSSNKKGNTRKSKSESGDYVETAAESILSANNINILSLGDTVIQGSSINATNNLLIGSFTIATNPDGSYQKDSNGNYITTSGSTVDNLTIKNADLQEYHYAQTSRGYAGFAAVGMRTLPYALAPLQIASNVTKNYMSTVFPDFYEKLIMKTYIGLAMDTIDKAGEELGGMNISETNTSRTDISTAHASSINVGGSMMTNSVGDTTIQGSNINIAGNLLSNSLGNFTISAATNRSSSSSSTEFETAGKFHSDLNVRRVNYKAGTTKEFVEEGETQNSTTLTSSNVNVGGSTLINSSDEFALLASNLLTTGSTEINSKNTLNILDDKETQSTSSYLDKLTLDVGVQVGNAYADAAYAGLSAIEALEKVKEAKDKLQKIENLQDQGLASSKAVERSKYQLVLAMLNAGLSVTAALQAAYGAAASSTTLGFYGAVYADITKLKATTTSEYAQSLASNLTSGDSIYLNSGAGDINITGSNIASTNGNLNLTAMLGAINIEAGESTYSTESKSHSQNLGGRIGTNGGSLNLGFSESASNLDQTTFNNSQLLAENGSLNINSKTDTNIIGANLLASDINLTVGGNLLVKSKQNLLESDFYSVGGSIGISSQSGSSVNGANIGLNMADGFQSKAWVEQLTSIIGTNSVIINTTNNTKIVGAEIANVRDGIDYGNLTLNTKSLTFENLKNHNNSESNSLGISLGLGFKDNDPSAPQNTNYTPERIAQNSKDAKAEEGVIRGPLKIDLSMHASESSSTTNATIGKGVININGLSATADELAGLNRDIINVEQNKKTVITSDFDTSLTIDMRLLAGAFYGVKGSITGDEKDKAKAQNNWNSYAGDTVAGAKLIKQTGIIPLKENNGGIWKLTTQLFGTNKLFETGDSKWQENSVANLDNTTLSTSLQNKDKFTLSSIDGAEVENDSNQQSNSFAITDKNGNTKTYNFISTLKDINQITLEDLTDTKDYSLNGVNNTSSEAFRNGLMQLGTVQDSANNNLNFVTLYAPSHGVIPDVIENLYNAFFSTIPNADFMLSANMQQMRGFRDTLGTTMQYENVTTQTENGSFAINTIDMMGIRAVGHSGGGDRLYLGLLSGASDGFGVDQNNNPIKAFSGLSYDSQKNAVYTPRLSVQFYGTPSRTSNIGEAAAEAGAKMDRILVGINPVTKNPIYDYSNGHITNSGDFVSNIGGLNAFQNSNTLLGGLKETGKSLISAPLLFMDSSPHSSYYCQGAFCGFRNNNFNQQKSPQTP